LARLALLIPNLGAGGAEHVTLSLAATFVRHGHEVDLVVMSATGDLLHEIPTNVQLFDLAVSRARSALNPLIKYLRRRRPEALLAAMWPLTTVAIIAAQASLTRTRVVVSDHSILSRQYAGKTLGFLRWSMRASYWRAYARIGVSQGCIEDLARLSALPLRDFTLIYNPARRPPDHLQTHWSAEHMWGTAERRILSVGSLKPAKRFDLLIRAFAKLGDSFSSKLLIVGEGELRAELETLVHKHGLADRVSLPGFVADPWPLYASANLFVLSSDREGLPGVIIEAMLAGLPVVSTDCESGPRELLDGGSLGRLVPVDNVEALAIAIRQTLSERHDPEPGRQHARNLTANSADHYLELLLGQQQ
jgi:glycosyltransferase involved in cell wall biosynthesis